MDNKNIKRALTYLKAEQIKHDNVDYTLFPNKNGGLCDITPMNAWSDSFCRDVKVECCSIQTYLTPIGNDCTACL